MLPTIAMSFISRMCSMRMTSLLPVVVMKMSASRQSSSVDHLEPVHRRLQRADRVDFGHLHAGAGAAQRRGRALADIAIAADDGDLAGHHHVGGAADAVDERFLAAVLVVEFRLGDAVVHVDRREGQLPLLPCNLVEAVHAGRGLLGDALDHVALLGEPAGAFGHALLDLREQATLPRIGIVGTG
jgi:hypothetical protein